MRPAHANSEAGPKGEAAGRAKETNQRKGASSQVHKLATGSGNGIFRHGIHAPRRKTARVLRAAPPGLHIAKTHYVEKAQSMIRLDQRLTGRRIKLG